MKPVDNTKDTATIQAVSRDEEGRKKVEKLEAHTHNVKTLKHIEKKLVDKGVQRMERHPVDGRGGIGKPPPKHGHGGKYTWEGPGDVPESELDAPLAIDEKDPNYVEEEEEVLGETRADVDKEALIGEVEVAKVAEEKEGVARVEVDPKLGG
ncbi:hypothetical protein Ancab_014422 [Ancistrocladus abbreviatus]